MNNDIIYWQISEPEFNQEEAWPEIEFPHARLHYIKEAGCLVTSLAVMLRLYGVEKEADPKKFNPWILCQKLKEIQAFSSNGDLEIESIRDLYPVCFLGSTDYSQEKLADCLSNGEMCLIKVNGVHDIYHFVLALRVCADDVEIYDSAWNYPRLSCFKHIYQIYRFCRLKEENLGACVKENVIPPHNEDNL